MVGKVIAQCMIERKLGEGGMGVVYLGRHTTLNKPVALKLLRQNLPTDANGIERFVREARAAASLDHAAIVNVYDAGHQNGLYYIVMQYVEGESLSARLERERRIPIDEALEIFEAAASGIEHAHSKGIIHRDIKPDNILLGIDGSVKIVDFGLARAVEYDANISQTGIVVGSPTFMSPEQALGKKTDARADIYALGATLYQMVTGEPPFRARGFMEAIWKIVKESPLAPHQVSPDVPIELSRYIHGLMRKDPRNRPQSISEALDNLRSLVRKGGLHQRRKGARRLLKFGVVAAVIVALAWYFIPWREVLERFASPEASAAPGERSATPEPAVEEGAALDATRDGGSNGKKREKGRG